LTGALALSPDVLTIGKAIAGGLPCGAYGLSAHLADRALKRTDLDLIDMGGVGGTLAGKRPVAWRRPGRPSREVLTDAPSRTCSTGYRLCRGAALGHRRGRAAVVAVSQLGGAGGVPVRLPGAARRTRVGGGRGPGPRRLLHVHAANRGVLLTPFHNMALICPATHESDVDRFLIGFREGVGRTVLAAPTSSIKELLRRHNGQDYRRFSLIGVKWVSAWGGRKRALQHR
jgi:glutamate-1-semialdehyde 2,1-aminomutase